MDGAVIALIIFTKFYGQPEPTQQFTVLPPSFAETQAPLPEHVDLLPIIQQPPTPPPPPVVTPTEQPSVPGDSGYIATCPDGTPAQGSCETPEGLK